MNTKSLTPPSSLLSCVCLSLSLAATCIQAESIRAEDVSQPSVLTVDRIFAGKEFKAADYDFQWLSDGSYTRIEPVKDGKGAELVSYAAETGERAVMVPAALFIPPGGEKPLKLDAYQWSDDLSKLLIFTNTRKVWRVNSRGDYWILDRESGILRRLGAKFPEASLMFAKLSPDASHVAYVQGNDIHLESVDSGEIKRLTTKPNDNIINGTFDWVYEEEFAIRDGFRWSPDGTRIAFWQLDTSQVPRFTLVNNTARRYPEIKQFAYPKAGQTNADCRVGVIDLQAGETTMFSFPGDARQHYIPRLEWSQDSRSIVVQRLNRLQNTLTLWLVDVHQIRIQQGFRDVDQAWVDVDDDFRWTKDGTAFVWSGERDGWNRLYRVSLDGTAQTALTPPDMDVISLLHFDAESDTVWYLASPDDATARYLYRSTAGDSTAVRLTPADQPGMHGYEISPESLFAVHRYSRMNQPPVVDLIRLSDHSQVRELESNAALREKVAALKLGESRFLKLNIDARENASADNGEAASGDSVESVITPSDEVHLNAWQILPPDFDPEKKYPLLIYIYGEPAGQTVLDQWGGSKHLWHLMMSQRGYVVMSIDGRGTPAPRGRVWRKSIYRKMGQLAVHDQFHAVQAAAVQFPFIDRERIGIWGWSGGGTMSLHAIFRYPETYKMAISVAPVPDLASYDTIYQERYMGLPNDNQEGYSIGSAIHHAEHLRGKLLLIHGTGDDNCHYQTTEMLINKLIHHKKQFTMMAYPNRSHSISEGKNTSLHLRQLMTDYVLQNL